MIIRLQSGYDTYLVLRRNSRIHIRVLTGNSELLIRYFRFFNIMVYMIVKGRSERSLLRLLQVLGLIMIASEVFKQWFCYVYLCDGQISLYYFPWQLCSMAMYMSFIAIWLKGRAQEAVLVYLCTFSLLGTIMALIFPGEMMLEGPVFMIHSFSYHTLIISEAIIAIEILKRRRRPSFRYALYLFLLTALIAEVINVIGRIIIHDPEREPDMFYISPFYPTTQIILSDVAEQTGRLPEIVLYLTGIILASYLIYLAEDRLFFRAQTVDFDLRR